MRSTSSKFLVLAVSAAIKADESVERTFTLGASKALAPLLEEYEAEDAKIEWRKMNVSVYRKLGLKKGDSLYGRFSKYASMLFTVGVEEPEILERYTEGKWTSLQGVYGALKGTKKAKKSATKKAKGFVARFRSMLENATPAQLRWVAKNAKAEVQKLS